MSESYAHPQDHKTERKNSFEKKRNTFLAIVLQLLQDKHIMKKHMKEATEELVHWVRVITL